MKVTWINKQECLSSENRVYPELRGSYKGVAGSDWRRNNGRVEVIIYMRGLVV